MEKINLLMCGNKKVFDGMLLVILSLIKHNNDSFRVFIMTMDLTDINERFTAITKAQISYLEKILKEKNEQSEIISIDMREMFLKEMKDSPNMFNFYTPYTMLRLFIDFLPFKMDRILYLDIDLMVLGDIKPLYYFDIDNVEFSGAHDVLGEYFIGANYTNAGVLLFNLKKCKETKLFEKCRYLCLNEKMAFLDQDALNRSVVSKNFFPYIYNVQRNMKKGTVIKHFCKTIRWLPFYHTENIKSWDIENIHKKLKIHQFDDVFEVYKSCKEELKEAD